MSNYRPGDIFDKRYLLEEHIGSGGFADVFKATDNMTNTVIAIKIYNSLDKHGVDIFQKEYHKVSDLHHSRLLTAHHFGIYNGSPYLIMPLCKKGSLTRLLIDEGHFLSEKKLAILLLQLSEGLEYLHKKGIVHQDIKPDNILEREEGEYVLTDFGISQRAKSTLAKSIRRTEKIGSNTSGYTPAYAPPARERLSTRAAPSKDIFSLGATLYELSAKQLPYNDMGEAVERKLEIPNLGHGYSQAWNDLLQSCLRLDAEDRPTAKKLKEAAQYFLAKGTWPLANKKQSSPAQPKTTNPRKTRPLPQGIKLKPQRKPKSKTKKSTNKKRWRVLLAIPILAVLILLGWGVLEMMSPDRIIVDPIPIVEDKESISLLESIEAQEEPQQKEYDKLVASAWLYFKMEGYEAALKDYQAAKGLVGDDHFARKGIEECKSKLLEIKQNRQKNAAEKNQGSFGTLTDSRDGKTYLWVRLKDGKKWMAQNLNYQADDSWCYDDDTNNCDKYGRLYTWAAAKKICPFGWHLPSDSEWRKMLAHYGKAYSNSPPKGSSGKRAYRALELGGSTGFNAQIGGRYDVGGRFPGGSLGSILTGGKFYALESLGYYWSATESKKGDGTSDAWSYHFMKGNEIVARSEFWRTFALSCRCVQN